MSSWSTLQSSVQLSVPVSESWSWIVLLCVQFPVISQFVLVNLTGTKRSRAEGIFKPDSASDQSVSITSSSHQAVSLWGRSVVHRAVRLRSPSTHSSCRHPSRGPFEADNLLDQSHLLLVWSHCPALHPVAGKTDITGMEITPNKHELYTMQRHL